MGLYRNFSANVIETINKTNTFITILHVFFEALRYRKAGGIDWLFTILPNLGNRKMTFKIPLEIS